MTQQLNSTRTAKQDLQHQLERKTEQLEQQQGLAAQQAAKMASLKERSEQTSAKCTDTKAQLASAAEQKQALQSQLDFSQEQLTG